MRSADSTAPTSSRPGLRLRRAVRSILSPRRAALTGRVLSAGLAAATSVAFSQPFPPVLDLSALDGSNGFVLRGIDPADQSGFAVANAGDFNADGIGDIVIG